MLFLYSVQVCTKNVSVKIVKEQFVVNFTNLCPEFGDTVNVIIEADIPGYSNTFNRQFALDVNRSGSGTLNCNNAQWGMNCKESIRKIKKNFNADITFRGANQQADNYFDIKVDVDTKTADLNLGLIVGCSVGGAVIIVIAVFGFVMYKKRHTYTKQVYDGQKMTLQNAPEIM
ncbi:Hypothetical_protein [Hexamita inflata]|uniref:Hypothetical_protein n=1 Tax=Hexamita inflata TaxID=28002 RepID=A0AA86PV36_9EUKA|nr:Hypothetical protein HINF_LOCUS31763 [Hexamita inflata]